LLIPVRVEGSSMEPTLPPRALLAVRLAAGDLTIGSVVVVRRPGGREDVKRIVAGPGQPFSLASGSEITLGEEEFAVVGDNLAASTDSRHDGPVTKNEIVAVARFCYWPPRAWRWFRRG
jgi:signal peptidase I